MMTTDMVWRNTCIVCKLPSDSMAVQGLLDRVIIVLIFEWFLNFSVFYVELWWKRLLHCERLIVSRVIL
jgi:hypothetical protein